MNWLQLKNLAASFIHRKDISWDDLQPLALDDINLALVVQENEGIASIPLTSSTIAAAVSSEGALPDEYCAMRAVMIGKREYNPVDIKVLMSGAQRPAYAVSGGKIYLNGGSSGSTAEIAYSTRIEPLATDDDHNPLSDRYSSIFLYGLLKHAAMRKQDFELQSSYDGQWQAAVTTANNRYMDAALGPGTQASILGGMG